MGTFVHNQAGLLNVNIKAEAERLGFQLAGITTPDPPPHMEAYERWLEAGRHGEMSYLAAELSRQRRADPRLVLPGCRSILVLGIRYPAPVSLGLQDIASAKHRQHPRGRVAAYAWGADYHAVLPARLQALVAFIEAQVGQPVSNRWYTDTGPVLERELAQRAGLGWIGKNTCLINPNHGSFFFLAEIFLGIDLQTDLPFTADRCGACTRCLEACPTSCILPDRTLDATRCISYLTIELKSSIPPELRPRIGDWVFGCDICQQVCPWNQRLVGSGGDPAFAPRPGVPRPNLLQEMVLAAGEFNTKFKGSPVQRAKRRGYLRNVAVALGNSESFATLAVLERAIQEDAEVLVREHAAWALKRIL